MMPQAGMQTQKPSMGPFAQAAQMGRGGDTGMAHVTPGEMVIPKQMQTPQVLAVLNKAFQEQGKSPTQYTVGSPEASRNPQTGLPEFNFMDTFLPIVLSMAGNAIMPGIGGAAGGALGSKLTGGSWEEALMSAAGGGLGGYGGNAFAPAASEGVVSASNAALPWLKQGASQASGGGMFSSLANNAKSGALPWNSPSTLFGTLPSSMGRMSLPGMNVPSMLGAGAGAFMGREMGKTAPVNMPEEDNSMPSGSWKGLLGMNRYKGPFMSARAYTPRYPVSNSYRAY